MKQILGLDLGNRNFRFVLGHQNKNLKPVITTAFESPSVGISKGSIIDVDDFIESLKISFDELSDLASGRRPKNLSITVAGPHINIKQSRGVIAISRADGEISSFDIDSVIAKSQDINLSQNKQLLHVVPREYTVDDLKGIKDPLGMHGIKLEVDSLIIEGFSPNLKTINKSFEELGFKIEDKIFKPLAAARAAISRKQEEAGCILIDLGAESTGFAVFEEGKLITIGSAPIGANHITHDLAICLKTSLDVAENIKINYGSAVTGEVKRKDIINLSKVDDSLEGEVSRKYLAEIIEARMEEIFDFISVELKKINRFAKLPGGVILVGAGAKLPYVAGFAKNYLRLPAKIGRPVNLEEGDTSEEIMEIVDDPAFVSAVGVFLLAMDNLSAEVSHTPSSFLSKIKKIGKMFLP